MATIHPQQISGPAHQQPVTKDKTINYRSPFLFAPKSHQSGTDCSPTTGHKRQNYQLPIPLPFCTKIPSKWHRNQADRRECPGIRYGRTAKTREDSILEYKRVPLPERLRLDSHALGAAVMLELPVTDWEVSRAEERRIYTAGGGKNMLAGNKRKEVSKDGGFQFQPHVILTPNSSPSLCLSRTRYGESVRGGKREQQAGNWVSEEQREGDHRTGGWREKAWDFFFFFNKVEGGNVWGGGGGRDEGLSPLPKLPVSHKWNFSHFFQICELNLGSPKVFHIFLQIFYCSPHCL
jgi:hypothetical protein